MTTTPSGVPLRVALLGNVVNCLLPIATALREQGMEADLFVDDEAPMASRPENVDPALAGAPWVRRGPWFRARWVLVPWRSPVVPQLRDYDLIVVSGSGPAFAQWAGPPCCWLVSGGDLTVTPFPWAFRSAFDSLTRRVGAYPLAFWQRRGARRARAIWVQPFAPMRDAIKRLGLRAPPVSDRYMPFIVDVDGLRPDLEPEAPPALRSITDRMASADLVLFHPTRLMLSDAALHRRSGQWKGNDRLLRAIGELRARGAADGVLVVLPELDGSRDLAPTKALVEELGIDAHVLWARPPGGEGFTREEMRVLYSWSHVVADEFAAGWFGLVTLEALAMGIPVVSHLDAGAMATLYPDGHPVRSAFEPSDIADRIQELRDPDLRAEVSAAGRAWVMAHHAASAVEVRYVAAVTEAALA